MAELSSINLEPSKENNTVHNTRTVAPSYLLKEKSLGVEFDHDHEKAEQLYLSLLREAVTNYTARTGQKIQAKKLKWSAVVNIKETTTMEELKNLAKRLYQEYGWQCYQIAIHRDEGHKDKMTGEIIYNLHAHLEFLMLNKEGLYCFKKGEWGKRKMSKLQDLVAEQLQMKRGVSALVSGKKRLNHYQYKQQMKAVEEALTLKKNEDLQQITSLNNEVSNLNSKLSTINNRFLALGAAYKDAPIKTKKELDELKGKIRREMIAEGGFTQEDYKTLSTVVAEIKKNFKADNFTVKSVITALIELQQENIRLKAVIAEKPKETVIYKEHEVVKLREYTSEEIESLPRVTDLKSITAQQNQKIAVLNNAVKELKQQLEIKPKEVIKTIEKPVVVKRELTNEEIESLPRVTDLKSITAQQNQKIAVLNNAVKELKQQLEIKPKEVIKTIEKPVIVERELTDEEIENLPLVQEIVYENEQLRQINDELSAQVDEYQEGLELVVNRIADEGYKEIATSILRTDSIRGMYEKIAEFITSSLKNGIRNIKKSMNTFRNKIF
ncbi:MAG: hypothetical protein ACI4NE_02685 [Succinivibrio sp.]